MKGYKEQITKDDKIFLNHAKINLGNDWAFVWAEAMDEYKKHDRESHAKRAANFVILTALKEIGKEHWRQPKEEKEKLQINPYQESTLPKREAKKKWNGPSILDMADAKKKAP